MQGITDAIGQPLQQGQIVAHASPQHGSTYIRPALVLELLPLKAKKVHVQYGYFHDGLWIPKSGGKYRWDQPTAKVYDHVVIGTHVVLHDDVICIACNGWGHSYMHEIPLAKDMNKQWP